MTQHKTDPLIEPNELNLQVIQVLRQKFRRYLIIWTFMYLASVISLTLLKYHFGYYLLQGASGQRFAGFFFISLGVSAYFLRFYFEKHFDIYENKGKLSNHIKKHYPEEWAQSEFFQAKTINSAIRFRFLASEMSGFPVVKEFIELRMRMATSLFFVPFIVLIALWIFSF